jgi:hypothetical protein
MSPCNQIPFNHTANLLSLDESKRDSTPSSSAGLSDTTSEGSLVVQCDSRKRRQTSESSSDALVRPPRKTRKLKAPDKTAKTREKGACFFCQKKRKEVRFAHFPKFVSNPANPLQVP